MTVYSKENPVALFQALRDRSVTNVASKRNLAVIRCGKCNLLFQTLRKYPHKTCVLCRYEASKSFQKVCRVRAYGRGENFDEKLFYSNALKTHQELQNRKDRVNSAYKVVTINAPTCSRII